MNESEPLFRGGRPNPDKLGFVPLRSSDGTEPDQERIREAARILGRQASYTDKRGYERELIAAAISETAGVAYVESRAKARRFFRHIDIWIRIHLVNPDGTHRSEIIESYNPFFGCDVRFFEWFGEAAVLIYREKHWTYACRFGDVWPPTFIKIEDQWVIHDGQLAYIGYKQEIVRRLSLPRLEELKPLTLEAASKSGLLPEICE